MTITHPLKKKKLETKTHTQKKEKMILTFNTMEDIGCVWISFILLKTKN